MAKILVVVVAPNGDEYDAEIEDTAEDEAIAASLIAGLNAQGINLPTRTSDGRQIQYSLQLEKGLKVHSGSRLFMKAEIPTVATIIGKH